MKTLIMGYLGKYQLALIGLVVLALGIYIGALKLQLGDAQGDLAAARGRIAEQAGQIKEWESSYQVLAKKTAEQNQAINELEQAEKTAHAKAQEAIKRASTISQARQPIIEAAAARPASGGDCSAAVSLAKRDLRGEL